MITLQELEAAIGRFSRKEGSYDELKEAVANFAFTRKSPSITSLDDLAENWEYSPVKGSFTDTIEVLKYRGVLTSEQVEELAGVARRTQEEGRG